MSAETVNLDQIMARLLDEDAAVRDAARREVQAWSFETAAAMLGAACQQAEDAAYPPSRLMGWRTFWKPSSDATTFPQPYDMLTVLLAEHQQDVRFAWAAMSVLACYHTFKERTKHTDSAEGRPSWGSGLITQR